MNENNFSKTTVILIVISLIIGLIIGYFLLPNKENKFSKNKCSTEVAILNQEINHCLDVLATYQDEEPSFESIK